MAMAVVTMLAMVVEVDKEGHVPGVKVLQIWYQYQLFKPHSYSYSKFNIIHFDLNRILTKSFWILVK